MKKLVVLLFIIVMVFSLGSLAYADRPNAKGHGDHGGGGGTCPNYSCEGAGTVADNPDKLEAVLYYTEVVGRP